MSIRTSLALALLLLGGAGVVHSQERMAGYLREEYSCIMCHTDKRSAFLEGVHAERGIVCVDCHGGDAAAFEREGAHARGFRGRLSKPAAVTLCLSCHSDIARMRPFGIAPVTREEFVTSRHGQRLLAGGDTAAPSCGDCHGSHAIFPRDDGRSPVNPAQVPSTCARCHADPGRMPQGLPTNQFEEWRASAHGVALLERHNSRAASCASCHGSHTALPPGVAEVANVCGKCHRLERDAYFGGVHGRLAEGVRSVMCIACHSNHGTEAPPVDGIRVLCARCHAPNSAPELAGHQLQEELLRAERAYAEASAAIGQLVRAGERTRDEEVRLLTLNTYLHELRVVAHTLDAEPIGELARRVESISREIRERAEVVAEERWERKLLIIPLWLGVLAGVALAARKRRILIRGAPENPEETGSGKGSGP
ncbi:MAG: cytochrome c3 family protein [Gemmatimonadetes bacterium]|nr:cytochrome c3 family protein [Gemmatimonadota bacterium]